MRGKGSFFALLYLFEGITPAYAGKSCKSLRSARAREDHPRLCGEKLIQNAAFLKVTGSPPPMRGKVILYINLSDSIQDHPRLCGEKRIVSASPDCVMGSPPPMRGKGSLVV